MNKLIWVLIALGSLWSVKTLAFGFGSFAPDMSYLCRHAREESYVVASARILLENRLISCTKLSCVVVDRVLDLQLRGKEPLDSSQNFQEARQAIRDFELFTCQNKTCELVDLHLINKLLDPHPPYYDSSCPGPILGEGATGVGR